MTEIDLVTALRQNEDTFGVILDDRVLDRLDQYHRLVLEHNELLHLVAPCSPEEFATRHLLESLKMLKHLPHGSSFADVGTGAGLPSIPCLLAREDLSSILIESKEKKATFLVDVIGRLDLKDRATVVNKQFSEVETTGFDHVACRALDKMIDRLPRLLKWSNGKRHLLYGGEGLANALDAHGVKFESELMPLSERRFLFLF